MLTEKITVRITQTGKTMEVAVFDKRAEHITVVLREGMHGVKCKFTGPYPLGCTGPRDCRLRLYPPPSGASGHGFPSDRDLFGYRPLVQSNHGKYPRLGVSRHA